MATSMSQSPNRTNLQEAQADEVKEAVQIPDLNFPPPPEKQTAIR